MSASHGIPRQPSLCSGSVPLERSRTAIPGLRQEGRCRAKNGPPPLMPCDTPYFQTALALPRHDVISRPVTRGVFDYMPGAARGRLALEIGVLALPTKSTEAHAARAQTLGSDGAGNAVERNRLMTVARRCVTPFSDSVLSVDSPDPKRTRTEAHGSTNRNSSHSSPGGGDQSSPSVRTRAPPALHQRASPQFGDFLLGRQQFIGSADPDDEEKGRNHGKPGNHSQQFGMIDLSAFGGTIHQSFCYVPDGDSPSGVKSSSPLGGDQKKEKRSQIPVTVTDMMRKETRNREELRRHHTKELSSNVVVLVDVTKSAEEVLLSRGSMLGPTGPSGMTRTYSRKGTRSEERRMSPPHLPDVASFRTLPSIDSGVDLRERQKQEEKRHAAARKGIETISVGLTEVQRSLRRNDTMNLFRGERQQIEDAALEKAALIAVSKSEATLEMASLKNADRDRFGKSLLQALNPEHPHVRVTGTTRGLGATDDSHYPLNRLTAASGHQLNKDSSKSSSSYGAMTHSNAASFRLPLKRGGRTLSRKDTLSKLIQKSRSFSLKKGRLTDDATEEILALESVLRDALSAVDDDVVPARIGVSSPTASQSGDPPRAGSPLPLFVPRPQEETAMEHELLFEYSSADGDSGSGPTSRTFEYLENRFRLPCSPNPTGGEAAADLVQSLYHLLVQVGTTRDTLVQSLLSRDGKAPILQTFLATLPEKAQRAFLSDPDCELSSILRARALLLRRAVLTEYKRLQEQLASQSPSVQRWKMKKKAGVETSAEAALAEVDRQFSNDAGIFSITRPADHQHELHVKWMKQRAKEFGKMDRLGLGVLHWQTITHFMAFWAQVKKVLMKLRGLLAQSNRSDGDLRRNRCRMQLEIIEEHDAPRPWGPLPSNRALGFDGGEEDRRLWERDPWDELRMYVSSRASGLLSAAEYTALRHPEIPFDAILEFFSRRSLLRVIGHRPIPGALPKEAIEEIGKLFELLMPAGSSYSLKEFELTPRAELSERLQLLREKSQEEKGNPVDAENGLGSPAKYVSQGLGLSRPEMVEELIDLHDRELMELRKRYGPLIGLNRLQAYKGFRASFKSINEMESHFVAADVDGDGYLCLEEFVQFALPLVVFQDPEDAGQGEVKGQQPASVGKDTPTKERSNPPIATAEGARSPSPSPRLAVVHRHPSPTSSNPNAPESTQAKSVFSAFPTLMANGVTSSVCRTSEAIDLASDDALTRLRSSLIGRLANGAVRDEELENYVKDHATSEFKSLKGRAAKFLIDDDEEFSTSPPGHGATTASKWQAESIDLVSAAERRLLRQLAIKEGLEEIRKRDAAK